MDGQSVRCSESAPPGNGGQARRSRGAAIALLTALTVALLAVAPGRWGTAHGQTAGAPLPPPPEPVETSTQIDGDSGGVLLVEYAGDASVSVTLPAGAAAGMLTIQFVPVDSANLEGGGSPQDVLLPPGVPALPPVEAGVLTPVSLFELNVTGLNGEATLRRTASVDIDLPPTVLLLAGGMIERIGISRFDTTLGEWQHFIVLPDGALPPAAGVCVLAGLGALQCGTNAFSLWAVSVIEPATPPIANAPTPPNTGGGAATGIPAGSNGAPLAVVLTFIALATVVAVGGRLATR